MQVPGEPEYRPAFEHTYIYDPATERRHGAVQWHETVPRIIDRQHEIRETLHPRYPPMLVRFVIAPISSSLGLGQLVLKQCLFVCRSRLGPGRRFVAPSRALLCAFHAVVCLLTCGCGVQLCSTTRVAICFSTV